jgi:hypothetical protein
MLDWTQASFDTLPDQVRRVFEDCLQSDGHPLVSQTNRGIRKFGGLGIPSFSGPTSTDRYENTHDLTTLNLLIYSSILKSTHSFAVLPLCLFACVHFYPQVFILVEKRLEGCFVRYDVDLALGQSHARLRVPSSMKAQQLLIFGWPWVKPFWALKVVFRVPVGIFQIVPWPLFAVSRLVWTLPWVSHLCRVFSLIVRTNMENLRNSQISKFWTDNFFSPPTV